MTRADAIERKESIEYEEAFLNTLKAQAPKRTGNSKPEEHGNGNSDR